MNKRNDWKATLNSVNTELSHYGVTLEVSCDDENTYSVNILGPDVTSECACGCFEEELYDVVIEAKSWAIEELFKFNRLNYALHQARKMVMDALIQYVEQHGEEFEEYHEDVLGVTPSEGERVLRVINFYDNGGCEYSRYVGNEQCETTAVLALYLTQNERGYKTLEYCGFYNDGIEYDEDESDFIADSIDNMAIEELYAIANKLQAINKNHYGTR